MNIQTASGYMIHGYRIRRASWTSGVLCRADGFLYHCRSEKSSDGRVYSITTSWIPSLKDLQSDDWELVLDGIAVDYGMVKYEDKL